MSYFEATQLVRSYESQKRGILQKKTRFNAVDSVSLQVEKGMTLGIVGESGCGKSTLARLLLGLIEADSGEVRLDNQSTQDLPEKAWRMLRLKMQLVYQNPASALDPRMKIKDQVVEPLKIHRLPTQQAETALQAVGFDQEMGERYPHELSGGQLQRVVIARALALQPELLILDEPVSALDVSIQAQIINLLIDLQKKRGLTYIFVSHDLSVVKHIANRVAVMYLGQIVEEAPRNDFFDKPLHPYSQALIDAVPLPNPSQRRNKRLSVGEPPNPSNPPVGCRFHPRCPIAETRCQKEQPALRTFAGRKVACHLVEEAE